MYSGRIFFATTQQKKENRTKDDRDMSIEGSLCVQPGCKNTGFQRENEATGRGECVAKLKLSISWEKVGCPITANISRGASIVEGDSNDFLEKKEVKAPTHQSESACTDGTRVSTF